MAPDAVSDRITGWLAALALPGIAVVRSLSVLGDAELPLLARHAGVDAGLARVVCTSLDPGCAARRLPPTALCPSARRQRGGGHDLSGASARRAICAQRDSWSRSERRWIPARSTCSPHGPRRTTGWCRCWVTPRRRQCAWRAGGGDRLPRASSRRARTDRATSGTDAGARQRPAADAPDRRRADDAAKKSGAGTPSVAPGSTSMPATSASLRSSCRWTTPLATWRPAVRRSERRSCHSCWEAGRRSPFGSIPTTTRRVRCARSRPWSRPARRRMPCSRRSPNSSGSCSKQRWGALFASTRRPGSVTTSEAGVVTRGASRD